MDEIYRGYRIAVVRKDKFIGRISNPRGPHAPIISEATLEEGADACLARARLLVDRYIAFLANPDAEV